MKCSANWRAYVLVTTITQRGTVLLDADDSVIYYRRDQAARYSATMERPWRFSMRFWPG